MDLIPLNEGIFLFVENMDRREAAICFRHIDVLHIGRIAKGDALLCKTVIHFVFKLVDGNDRVGRDPAINLQKERGFDGFPCKTMKQFRF